jgi:membrane-bound lytic murein transglycosylase D
MVEGRFGERLAFAILALVLVIPSLSAVAAPSEREEDPFPSFPILAGNVEFWKRVFAEWSMGQIAVHDLDHPAVVYEVVALDGPLEFPYTDDQRDFVDDLRESWEDRLEELERKVEAGEPLSEDDKALALKITTGAGTDAVKDARRRVRTQRGLKEQFRRGLEISGRYDARFREIFREHGLPEDLAYLPHVESSFQGSARSSAGAVGVWQFTRGTGRNYLVVNSTLDERLDPTSATYGAARYLRDAYERLGSWPLALTSYNHGVQGMAKARKQFGTDFERIVLEYRSRSFGFASKNFYAEFLAAVEIAESPERYFPEGIDFEPPPDLEERTLTRRTTPGQLARQHGVPLEELTALNPAWSRKAVRNGYALPVGTRVWLPKGSLGRLAEAGSEGLEHVVKRGDTLSTIAARYGTTVSELRRLNGIPGRSSLIRVGQRLVVGEDVDKSGTTTTHVVRRGETLSSIALRYDMSVSDVRQLNGMSSGQSLIRAGQKIVVLGPAGAVHVVRRGDTLTEIAVSYGVRLSDLLYVNKLSRKSVIYPGQEIHIP